MLLYLNVELQYTEMLNQNPNIGMCENKILVVSNLFILL